MRKGVRPKHLNGENAMSEGKSFASDCLIALAVFLICALLSIIAFFVRGLDLFSYEDELSEIERR